MARRMYKCFNDLLVLLEVANVVAFWLTQGYGCHWIILPIV